MSQFIKYVFTCRQHIPKAGEFLFRGIRAGLIYKMRRVVNRIMVSDYLVVALYDGLSRVASFSGNIVTIIIRYVLVVYQAAGNTLVPSLAATRCWKPVLVIGVYYLDLCVTELVILLVEYVLNPHKGIIHKEEGIFPFAFKLVVIICCIVIQYRCMERPVVQVKSFAVHALGFT